MEKRSDRILVLGLGNDIHQDVGIPVKLVEQLQSQMRMEAADFESSFVGGLELLEQINAYKGVVFIDTIKTEEGIPGRIHDFDLENYRETLHLSCRHDVSFLMSIETGKKLGFHIPPNILILGIEILADLEFGAGFSKKLIKLYPGIFKRTREYIEDFSRRILIGTSL